MADKTCGAHGILEPCGICDTTSEERVWLLGVTEQLAVTRGRFGTLPTWVFTQIGFARALDLLDTHGWRFVALTDRELILRR